MQGFGCKLVYYGRHEKPAMKELGGVEFEPDLEAFVGRCDIITINISLTNKTRFVHLCHRNVVNAGFLAKG